MLRELIIRIIRHKSTPYLVLVLILFIMLIPFYWILITSFKPLPECFLSPPTYFPKNFTLNNYIFSLSVKGPILRYILNSSIIAASTTAVVLISSIFTAYALSQYRFRGSNVVLSAYLFTRIIPPISMLVPFYILFRYLGLLNTWYSVIIYSSYMCYPLVMWMLKGFFDKFPRELIDAARIDGCSRTATLFRVVLPVSAGAISAAAIITFMWSWNEFLAPFVFIHSDELKPITVGLFYFVGDEITEWSYMCAAGILAIIPSIFFVIMTQKYIVKGLAAGAVKG